MKITLFSFLFSVIWSSVIIIGTYFLRKIPRFVEHFGILVMFFLYVFSIVRMILPLEFTSTIVIESHIIYPTIFRVFEKISLQINLFNVFIIVWILVTAILLLYYVLGYHKAIRQILNYAKPCGVQEKVILQCVQSITKRNVSVTIYTCIDTDIPFGFGIFNKKILLPQKEYNDEELYYIIRHEYTHFLNHDTIVKTMTTVFCIIFWWNPVVYLLKKDLEQTLEIKCDLKVIKSFDTIQKARYLQAIVSSMKKVSIPNKIPYETTALVQNGQVIEIKERFQVVMQYSNKKKSKLQFTIIFTAIVFCSIISYIFLPQPAFDPSPIENGFDRSNSFIEVTEAGQYELYINNELQGYISKTEADMYIKDGFKIIRED